jgi:hypothetical protein|tara:strand:- start:11170 stop:11400 length:231 start_codon:yes stop_codon:yes gene_type:complete
MIGKDKNQNLIYLSIDTIEDIIKAKNKAEKVIESCKNDKHLNSAKNYIKLYLNATDDLVGSTQLELQLLEKRKELC